MELSILERLMAIGVLPKEGNYATLKILNQLKLSLSFSEKEYEEFGIEVDIESNQTRWKVEGDVEIPIGETATDVLVSALKDRNKKKTLSADMMTLYEKFIPSDA
jgi:hypothetical protein